MNGENKKHVELRNLQGTRTKQPQFADEEAISYWDRNSVHIVTVVKVQTGVCCIGVGLTAIKGDYEVSKAWVYTEKEEGTKDIGEAEAVKSIVIHTNSKRYNRIVSIGWSTNHELVWRDSFPSWQAFADG
ncbi:hypothetical protein ACH5RR_032384 [Cinchona calisaya]|uniref:Uncharacterized protein n=1 Tax=Cinchona calisaya TaxID=153742 RepID=A0ABD2YMB8_9GENT